MGEKEEKSQKGNNKMRTREMRRKGEEKPENEEQKNAEVQRRRRL
jgi:hypothetical protein